MCVWFDTHFHLSPERASEDHGVLEAARAADVRHFLLQGTSRRDCPHAMALARAEEGVLAAVGLHPEAAEEYRGLDEWLPWYDEPRVAAVGEIGLDYHYTPETAALQRRVFADFLELAGRLALPAVIHCRDAFRDCIDIVRDHLPPGAPFIVHSFTGTMEEAAQWLELGAHISVNGMLTFRRADDIRTAVSIVPLERMLLETDSPYLAPVPFRGHENSPAYIPVIGAKLAELRGKSPEDIARITTANGLRLFRARALS